LLAGDRAWLLDGSLEFLGKSVPHPSLHQWRQDKTERSYNDFILLAKI